MHVFRTPEDTRCGCKDTVLELTCGTQHHVVLLSACGCCHNYIIWPANLNLLLRDGWLGGALIALTPDLTDWGALVGPLGALMSPWLPRLGLCFEVLYRTVL